MIRIRQLRISIDNDRIEELKKKVSKRLKISINEIKEIKINKKAIDARDEDKICFVYEVDVLLNSELKVLKKVKSNDIFITPDEEYKYVLKKDKNVKPVVVGSGPAGLFCAYFLAEAGYNPLVIERGEKIEDRVKTVDDFWNNNKLNLNSNVQFGEGGAGTFSDGKLNTLVKDREYRMKKVFEIFVSCGAPKEIMYIHNPHIGTDILRKVVINLRHKIIEMGGCFRYNTCMTDIKIKNNQVCSIEVNNNEEILCDTLILAIGHSARDTFKLLYSKGVNMTSKAFAVGFRIVHKQELIDKNQYGKSYKKLSPASYKLSYTTKTGRGIYSFCMCPGGYVVNASSENKRLVVNGMSNYDRGNSYSNSAIIASVNEKDYGLGIFAGMNFQEQLEEKAYKLGNGSIPIQKYNSFINNKSDEIIENLGFIKGKYKFSNLYELFTPNIRNDLIEGIENFNKKINGFTEDDVYLLGVETRSSSPVRILRDDNLTSNIKGLYPCGEGAGYAGGITTSAIDGIKVAEKIGNAYKK